MPSEEEIVQNLERCPYFERCSQNLCPLDLELYLRTGGKEDKCRWMRETRKVKIGNKKFLSGGETMPDAILKFVPRENIKMLNKFSQKRWKELRSKGFLNKN
jgi:hypothetical protein